MLQVHLASILHFLEDPAKSGEEDSYRYYSDGALVVEDGLVKQVGDSEELLSYLPRDADIFDHGKNLLVPGFIDVHVHYPQMEIIASYGEHLLEWLEKYTFPAEAQFGDVSYAHEVSEQFVKEMLRVGTTSALVFGTVHPVSLDSFFEVCEKKNLRMIAGKVMMDRNAPSNLLDTAESSYTDSKALIEKWHGRGRLQYAVTPRFSVTSSPEQLEKAGQLREEYPSIYLQTHLSESKEELSMVRKLFPGCKNYLDTYDSHGLLGPRSIFAHCIHLEEDEWSRLSATQSSIAFCSSSNLFLGSGLFSLSSAERNAINVGLGSDVGGGTSLSMLSNMNDAYKILRLRSEEFSPLKAFYLATLGGAEVLDLDHTIGNFEPGKEADFVVLDRSATPLIEFRLGKSESVIEDLFVFSMLGDDRVVKQTWSAGLKVHDRDIDIGIDDSVEFLGI